MNPLSEIDSALMSQRTRPYIKRNLQEMREELIRVRRGAGRQHQLELVRKAGWLAVIADDERAISEGLKQRLHKIEQLLKEELA
jgi:hypothetical protein